MPRKYLYSIFKFHSNSRRRKRRYESVSEDDSEPEFYDEEYLDTSLFSNDTDGDLGDDQENCCDIDFEEASASHACFEVDSDFESDSDDESDFDADDSTDHDDDWSWDEALDDPLASSTYEGKLFQSVLCDMCINKRCKWTNRSYVCS